jgi:hypothetical protein
MVNLDRIVLLDDPSVVKVFMNLILSQGVLDVALLDLLTPTVVEMVNLASHFTAVLQIVALVDF